MVKGADPGRVPESPARDSRTRARAVIEANGFPVGWSLRDYTAVLILSERFFTPGRCGYAAPFWLHMVLRIAIRDYRGQPFVRLDVSCQACAFLPSPS